MSGEIDANEKTSDVAITSRTTDNLSSLPTDQNDECDGYIGIDLLHKMDIEDIEELRKHFYNQEELQKKPKKFQYSGLYLNKTEFIGAMGAVAGEGDVSGFAGKLFELIDRESVGVISWDQVLDAIIEKTDPSMDKYRNAWMPIDPDAKIHSIPHCKRESIVKVIPLESKSAFCYAIVSKLGRVGVYDSDFNLLDSYKLALKPTEDTNRTYGSEKEEKRRRSQTTWIADAVLIEDSTSLMFASSDRSLHLYDANCLVHIPLCRVIGLNNVPTCLEYHPSSLSTKPSILFIGDDCGNVITMKFHQPKTTLFKKKHPDKLDNYYWSELTDQSDYVTYTIQTGVHNDGVTQMTYCPSNETLISCSNDPGNALVIRHIDGRRHPYIFKVTRGIKCFHYERSMHVVATGSSDFVVRLWNEVVTKQAVISLYGHKAPVVDVRIVKQLSAIISLSKAGVVKVWDLNDYYCQMTLPVPFPILKVIGARVDFGPRSIFPGPKTLKELSDGTSSSKEVTRRGKVLYSGDEETVEDTANREEAVWSRKHIIIACANYVATLRLVPFDGEAFYDDLTESDAFLPPPPEEHFASAPSPWKIAESYTRTPAGSEGSRSKSSDSSNGLRDTAYKTSQFQNFTGDSIKSPLRNMNTKRSQYNLKQEQMKMLVEQCAPHLALDLHELEPIKFSKPLPVTRKMREKGIDVSDPERVIKARIQRDPTLMSVGSSAQSPRSTRSSKSTSAKKKFVPSKGRVTPEWFTDKIKAVYLDSSATSTLSQ